MNSETLFYSIALSKVPFVGPKSARKLLEVFDSPRDVFLTNEKELLSIPGINKRIAQAINSAECFDAVEKELKFIEKNKIKVLLLDHSNFPSRLKFYDTLPTVLYFMGEGNVNCHRTIGIVGTRKPSKDGVLMTEKLVEQSIYYESTIISGLAYGVDTLAHKNSIKFGIPTIGVLGHGLDMMYPLENRKLAESMLENGGLITEFGIDTKPDRVNFPMRNRIIAALSDALIVVESKRKGGSIISAEYSNEFNKDVFAVPGKPFEENAQGCNALIKTHKAHLLESMDDVGYIMRWDKSETLNHQSNLFYELSEDEKNVVDILRFRKELTLDELNFESKLSLSSLAGIMLNLEFNGVVKSLPGKVYILC